MATLKQNPYYKIVNGQAFHVHDGSQMAGRVLSQAERDHYDFLNEVAGSEYEDMVRQNPYINLTYTQSARDKFANVFGFTSQAESTWMNDRLSNIASEDAKVRALMQENAYNSPSQQSNRMRAAGQNPDILGTGEVESAASMQPDETPLAGTTGDIGGLFEGIANGLLSVIGTGFNIYRDMTTLNSTLDAQSISNYGGILGLAKSLANSQTKSPAAGLSLEEYIEQYYNKDAISDSDLSKILDSVNGISFRSSRNKKMFANAYQNYKQSSEYRDFLASRYKGKITDVMDIGKLQADPAYSDYSGEVTKVMMPLYKVIFDEQFRNLESRLAKDNFDFDYWNNRSGSNSSIFDEGILENSFKSSGYRSEMDFYDKEFKSVEYKFTKAYRDMISMLYKDASNGDKAAQSILMSLFTSNSFLDKFSASLSFGPKGVKKSIGF